MYTQPAKQGHQGLEKGKHARNAKDLALLHAGLVEAVGQGDREGIHGEAHTQQGVADEKGRVIHHDGSSVK